MVSSGNNPAVAASAQDALAAAAQGAKSQVVLPDSVSMGVDIVEIDRIKAIMERSPAFVERAFSCEERAYCDASAKPECHYATRFAAKEAVLKALGTGFSRGIKAADVEVALNSKGKPYVRLKGKAAAEARQRGIREIPLSLSYTHSEAVACALALTEDEREAAKAKKQDPVKELGKRFKEARSLLDEIPAAQEEGE